MCERVSVYVYVCERKSMCVCVSEFVCEKGCLCMCERECLYACVRV